MSPLNNQKKATEDSSEKGDFLIRDLWQKGADIIHYMWTYIGITCSSLPQNNGNLPSPFFGGNYPIFILDIIY